MSRPDPTETRKRIVEIIGECVYQALGLKESLQDERQALETQDMGALNSAIGNKSQCTEALRALDEERITVCTAASFPAGPEQLQQIIEWCDDDSVLANCWQHLMDIVVECNAQNLTNGAIIRGRKQQIESSLAIIRGGDPDAGIYGRSGRGASGSSQRPLAEA